MADTKHKSIGINQLKRRVKELEIENERLRASVGYEMLHGWKPNVEIEKQFGWSAWLDPLHNYLQEHTNPYHRNAVMYLVTAIISQIAIQGKYGIKIPLEPVEIDSDNYFSRQAQILIRNYDPCIICGEKRITHECHIIPRSEGGPYHRDNFFTLCPLHHHLFDHNRLNKDEWSILSDHVNTKLESAIVYFKEVREKIQQFYWGEDPVLTPELRRRI